MKHLLPTFLLFLYCATYAQDKDRPNIVLIITDDQGYHDLSCYGANDFSTPNIDQLANEGVKLTQYYAAQPVCTASRASLLTGCYPNRIGMHYALMPDSKTGIHPNETTLAELLKSNGYSTAIIGKWHLGDAEAFMPLNHGFDYFYGIPFSNDMWPNHPQQGPIFDFDPLLLYRDNQVIDTIEDQSNLTKQLTHESIEFIHQNHDQPFFLYLAHPQPHVPLYTSKEFQGRTERGLYGDVIEEIDWSVGQIVETLKATMTYHNTLIIFTSDNGPWLCYGNHAGSAHPFREGKTTTWEGGIRVPFIASLPGRITGGRVIDEAMMSIDILPTLAELTESSLPELPIDGRSGLDLLTGKSDQSPQEAYYFYYERNQLQAILWKNWKLHLKHKYYHLTKQGQDGLPGKYEYVFLSGPELYDLSQDISESNNVYDHHPELRPIFDSLAQHIRSKLGDQLSQMDGSETRAVGKIEQ